jgi:hypothetical protein
LEWQVTHLERRFHEEFSTDSILKEIRLLSPGLLIGENPSAFALEPVLRWGFWTRRWSFGTSRWVVMLKRNDLPEELRPRFGLHCGAVITSVSGTPTLLNNEVHLSNFYMDSLVDAQFRRGEFAVEASSS